MAERLVSSDAFLRVGLQHLFEQVHDDGVDLLVLLAFEVEAAGPVLFEHFVVGLALENAFAEQKNMEDKSQAEHIADRRVFLLHVADIDDFWCHVAGGAAPHKKILVEVGELS